ncbi:MAG: hypothetical protein D6730_06910 [Bacteroidetes bacterium]|nr:MAG: hypothetical protein D6730_06910 [Bacteroidota bacterium]
MKTLKQAFFQHAAKQHEVLELALCKQQEGYFLRKRQGRVCGQLQEMKWEVGQDQARAITAFEAEIASIGAQGFVPGTQPGASAVSQLYDLATRRAMKPGALLQRLSSEIQGRKPAAPVLPIRRVFRLLAEHQLPAAEEGLLRLGPPSSTEERYHWLAAVGRCSAGHFHGYGTGGSLWEEVVQAENLPFVRQMAAASCYWAQEKSFSAEQRKTLLSLCPQRLRQLLEKAGNQSLYDTALELMQQGPKKLLGKLGWLYLAGREQQQVKAAVLKLCCALPLVNAYVPYLQHLMELALVLDDAYFIAQLLYHLEHECYQGEPFLAPSPQGPAAIWSRLANDSRAYQQLKSEMHKQINRLSGQLFRWLLRMGENQNLMYLRVATKMLLCYQQPDYRLEAKVFAPMAVSRYRFHSDSKEIRREHIHYDAWAGQQAFYLLLFGNSSRYALRPYASKWQCVPPFRPGGPIARQREEAFPALWDRQPASLLFLATRTPHPWVKNFALKALRDHPLYLEAYRQRKGS